MVDYGNLALTAKDTNKLKLMTSKEFEAIIRKAKKDEDKAHIFEYDLRAFNLRDYNLSNIAFHCCNMDSCDLSGLDLTRSRFDACSLIGTDFSGAKLEFVDLTGCDMQQANLQTAKCFSASFRGANLQTAILQDGDFRGCGFGHTNLIGAISDSLIQYTIEDTYILSWFKREVRYQFDAWHGRDLAELREVLTYGKFLPKQERATYNNSKALSIFDEIYSYYLAEKVNS